uniref:Uncharacterized protein n=1 Tax=Leersia perrieri TaxID=77586 RepID=A0A0D9WGG9_9ORYZ
MATATAAEEDGSPRKKKQGGFKTLPFILVQVLTTELSANAANEVCDRFATAGFNANMITYLTQQLHLPLVEASNLLTNFTGTAAFTPVLGAIVADSFTGRFWTIAGGGTLYQLGMLGLVVSALLPALRPAPCSGAATCQRADGGQLAALYLSLLCTALGSGGIRPCVVAFGADQFGLGGKRPGGEQKWSYFNLYFFSMGLAVLLALTVVVYIQENVGWGWGFGVPAIAMFVSVSSFVIGYSFYVKVKPEGSPFKRLVQVVVAAFKKVKEPVPEDAGALYHNKELDAAIAADGRLLHTDQLRQAQFLFSVLHLHVQCIDRCVLFLAYSFLDRAAIVTAGDIAEGSGEPNLWRVSTVHRVEELKSIVRMLPLWAASITAIAAGSHNFTFAIQQARTMDRHVTPRFQIPPATMIIFTTLTMLVSLALYDRVLVPVARRYTGRRSGITYFQRMGAGFAVAALGVLAGALVEAKRRGAAAQHGLADTPGAVVPVSVFWLVPQYALHGVGDALATVGHMEFLYDQSPESMRSSAAALFWVAGSLGNYLGTVLVTVVQSASGGEWLQDNINRGRLDYYYWLVTVLLVLNLAYYFVCFHFYTLKSFEVDAGDEAQRPLRDVAGNSDGETKVSGDEGGPVGCQEMVKVSSPGIETQILLEASSFLGIVPVTISTVELDLLLRFHRLQWLKGVVPDADEVVDEVEPLQPEDEPVVVVQLRSVEVVLQPLPAPLRLGVDDGDEQRAEVAPDRHGEPVERRRGAPHAFGRLVVEKLHAAHVHERVGDAVDGVLRHEPEHADGQRAALGRLLLCDADVTSRMPAAQMGSMRRIDFSSSTRCTVDSRHRFGSPDGCTSPSVTIAAFLLELVGVEETAGGGDAGVEHLVLVEPAWFRHDGFPLLEGSGGDLSETDKRASSRRHPDVHRVAGHEGDHRGEHGDAIMSEDKSKDDAGEQIQQGGIKTMPFILANDFCDRFATIGFNANLITYLTAELHLPLVEASNTLTNFHGASNLTPIVGGLIADSFAGRFWTIAAGSVAYQLGMVGLTVSALMPSLRPPPCHVGEAVSGQACQRATPWQLLVLYASLICTSIGTGGTRPCVMAFGADQFELRKPRRRGEAGAKDAPRWSFFNLYFFGVELAKLVAITAVVYIQENVGWGLGLGVPTVAMLAAVTAFVAGYPLYVKMAPGCSPLTRLAQVAVAAYWKRNVAVPDDPGLLYDDKELDAGVATTGRLLHTNQLTFFDRAAVVTDGDVARGGVPRPWRLSTVHRVEELKSIVRMLPIWAAGILLVTSASHNHSFAIQQARTMDRRVTARLEIPPATMLIFSNVAMLTTLALYDRVLVPRLRRLTRHPSGITHLQRTGIGLAISTVSNVVAAVVEGWRKRAAARHSLLDSPGVTVPMSVFWMAPQYAIHGAADAFMDVGRMEFLYDQAPEGMRSTAAALYWLTMSAGSYMGTLLVTVVHERTKGEGEWLQDNLNRGRLDSYYWLVVTLQLINVVYFVICAKLYTYKRLETVDQDSARERDKTIDQESVGGRDEKESNVKDVELQPLLLSDVALA